MSQPNKAPYDFIKSITQPFQSRDGFVWRAAIMMAALFSVTFIIFFPMLYTEYGQLLDVNQQNMQDILAGREPESAEEIVYLFSSVWRPYLVMSLLLMLIPFAGETALHRKYLLGTEEQIVPLRFMQPELRTTLAAIGVWLTVLFAYILLSFALGVLGAISAMLSPVLSKLAIFVGVVFLLGFSLRLSIRLAPAAALSVNQNRLYVLKAREVSNGRIGPMLASYAFVFFFGYILLVSVLSVLMTIVFGESQILSTMNGLGDQLPSETLKAMAEQLQSPLKKFMGVAALVAYFTVMSLWFLTLSGIGTYAVKLWESENGATSS